MKNFWCQFIVLAVLMLIGCEVLSWEAIDRDTVLALIFSFIATVGFALLLVMFPCLCIWLIAGKTNTKPRWMAWIPLLYLFVLCRIGRVSKWWAYLSLGALIAGAIGDPAGCEWAALLSLAGVVGTAVLLFQLPKALGEQNASNVFLIVVPLVNYFYMGYLAFRTEKPQAPQVAPIANDLDATLPIGTPESQSTPPRPISETKEPSNSRNEVMDTSRKQRLIVILAACALIVALLFPPWLYTYDKNGSLGAHSTKSAGYCCLIWAPVPERDYWGKAQPEYGVRIDSTRLLLEFACIAVASAVAFLFASVKPPPE
jgi:FtsH-binding integral membrane protein